MKPFLRNVGYGNEAQHSLFVGLKKVNNDGGGERQQLGLVMSLVYDVVFVCVQVMTEMLHKILHMLFFYSMFCKMLLVVRSFVFFA